MGPSGVALEIVNSDLALLEINTRKLRQFALDDLQEAAQHGTCTQFLWDFLDSIRITIKSDVQENEGVSGVIKHVVDQSPSIKIPLLDARVRLKRALGVRIPWWLVMLGGGWWWLVVVGGG